MAPFRLFIFLTSHLIVRMFRAIGWNSDRVGVQKFGVVGSELALELALAVPAVRRRAGARHHVLRRPRVQRLLDARVSARATHHALHIVVAHREGRSGNVRHRLAHSSLLRFSSVGIR